MIKKLYSLFFVLFFTVISLFNLFATKVEVVSAEQREINIYSVEDYIGEDVIQNFNDTHDFVVNYYTMATVEDLYNELKKNPQGVNLLCPSEYMIMKMKDEGLIKSFEKPDNFKNSVSPFIDGKFDELGFYEDEKTYAVGYMWGTIGFVYNMEIYPKPDSLDGSDWDLNNWNAVLNDKYFDRITIKDSVRDTYIMAVGAVKRDALLSLDKNDPDYNQKLTAIFNSTDDETIAQVEEFLKLAKQNLYCFEVDSAKSDIIRNRIDVYFAWSGDAVYAIESGAEVDVQLGFNIPDEGSNLWFDAYVMSSTTTGQQEQDCIEFLDYLCSDDVVLENMDYTGYTSCMATDAIFELAQDWYSAECELEYYTIDEVYDFVDNEEYSLEDFACVDSVEDLYCLIGYYGEVVENDGEYNLVGQEVKEDGSIVDSSVPVIKLDLGYFFDPEDDEENYVIYSTEDTYQMLYAQYPDEETIKRCAIMSNFDNETLTKIDKMWTNVKLVTLSPTAIVLIIILFVLVIAFLIVFKKRTIILSWHIVDKLKPKNKDKIVKVEKIK